jgi:c-di-GMP-related signal transduction protein
MDLLLSLHPVFDKNINIYGYKVLYYINSSNDAAYSQAVIEALDLEKLFTLTGNKPIFLDFTKTFIEQETALSFPSNKLVIDLPEYFNPDKTIIKKLDILKRMGYIIAWGNGRHPAYTPGIIRFDF